MTPEEWARLTPQQQAWHRSQSALARPLDPYDHPAAVARRERRANYWAVGLVVGLLAVIVLIVLFLIAMQTSRCNAIIDARQIGLQPWEQPEEWQTHCGPIS